MVEAVDPATVAAEAVELTGLQALEACPADPNCEWGGAIIALGEEVSVDISNLERVPKNGDEGGPLVLTVKGRGDKGHVVAETWGLKEAVIACANCSGTCGVRDHLVWAQRHNRIGRQLRQIVSNLEPTDQVD